MREITSRLTLLYCIVGSAAQNTLTVANQLHQFHPGEVWLDTEGKRIQAHQPHVVGPLNNGTYYWYGSAKVGSSDGNAGVINVYSSVDLYNWQPHGAAFNCGGYCARPSFLGKNPKTGRYVLWVKGGSGFLASSADTPLGPFRSEGSFKPTPSSTSGDSASFKDPMSNDAYIAYSQHTPERAIKVVKLDSDWTALSTEPPVATVPGHLEAPVPFHSFDNYHIWTSHTSGWKPNPAELITAGSMLGKWSSEGNPSGNKTTFGTQGSHILPLGVPVGGSLSVHDHGQTQTQRFLYMGDRYEPYINTTEGSRYIFLPMEVTSDGAVRLKNMDGKAWSIADWPM